MANSERDPFYSPKNEPLPTDSSHALDAADADRRVADQRQRDEELRKVLAEPETAEEREFRLARLRELTQRYDSDKAA